MSALTDWSLLGAGALIGAAIAAAVTVLIVRRSGADPVKAQELERRLDRYKDDVAAHYAETAKRIDALTQAYKSVYDHLEDGAYRLVGERELRRRLDDAGSEPVTLEGIATRALRDAASSDSGAPADASAPSADDGSAASDANRRARN